MVFITIVTLIAILLIVLLGFFTFIIATDVWELVEQVNKLKKENFKLKQDILYIKKEHSELSNSLKDSNFKKNDSIDKLYEEEGYCAGTKVEDLENYRIEVSE